jgi:hypothetical protein
MMSSPDPPGTLGLTVRPQNQKVEPSGDDVACDVNICGSCAAKNEEEERKGDKQSLVLVDDLAL